METGPVSYDISVSGYSFKVLSAASQDELREVASMVDERIESLRQAGTAGDTIRLSLLASMQFAGELLESRRQIEKLKRSLSTVEQFIGRMSQRIDQTEM